MRLFIAAELSSELIEALAETSARLRDCVRGRYVAPDSFHVTLAFLGEVEPSRIQQAGDALERGRAAAVPFNVELGEFGSFGRRSKATLWQGFRDAGALPDLAKSVRAELRGSGFAFDDKSFLPHVTLMRAADLTGGNIATPVMASGSVERITLFRSNLSGPRPVYEPLR